MVKKGFGLKQMLQDLNELMQISGSSPGGIRQAIDKKMAEMAERVEIDFKRFFETVDLLGDEATSDDYEFLLVLPGARGAYPGA